MKVYQNGDYFILEMKYAKIASKDKKFIGEELLLRKEKCYCKNNGKCDYCIGLANPRLKENQFIFGKV